MESEVREPAGILEHMYVITPTDKGGPSGHHGKITNRLGDGYYLVEWYSWLTGGPTFEQIFSIGQMQEWSWQLYFEKEAWEDAIRAVAKKDILNERRTSP